jgi:hypothetical protein
MNQPNFKFDRGEWVLWEGFDAGGGAFVYLGQVVDRTVGETTNEHIYGCYFPELRPYPGMILLEDEIKPLKEKRD